MKLCLLVQNTKIDFGVKKQCLLEMFGWPLCWLAASGRVIFLKGETATKQVMYGDIDQVPGKQIYHI